MYKYILIYVYTFCSCISDEVQNNLSSQVARGGFSDEEVVTEGWVYSIWRAPCQLKWGNVSNGGALISLIVKKWFAGRPIYYLVAVMYFRQNV